MKRVVPVGYEVKDGLVKINKREAQVVKKIFSDYLAGTSMNNLCKIMINEEIDNWNGEVIWQHSSIGKILSNKKYLGDEMYPRILEDEVFYKVEMKRAEKSRLLGKNKNILVNGKNSNFYLNEKIECGECGGIYKRYTIHHDKNKNCQWTCNKHIVNGRIKCRNIKLEDGEIEKVFCMAIKELKNNIDLIKVKKNGQRKKIEIKPKEFNNICEEVFYIASKKYEMLNENNLEYLTDTMIEKINEVNIDAGFNEELFKNIVNKIIIYQNEMVEVEFINDTKIKLRRK